jgi:pimeloyl-ACP methyl ester carboxylesterase
MHNTIPSRLRLGLAAAVALVLAIGATVAGTTRDARAVTAVTTEVISGTLPDGTLWRIAKPTPWNGTIVLDLDGYGNASPTNPGALQRWMTDNGYAIGGTQREPVAYEFPRAVENLISVRTTFVARFGTPARTLTIGSSRGGFVSRLAMELHPEIFEGAVLSAGGGAGEIATFNAHLDGLFALKTLVDPNAPIPLEFPSTNAFADNTQINALVRKAMQTPEGRARLGLAAAFEQMPLWSSSAFAGPATDADGWIQQLGSELNPAVGTVFGFANPAQVRQGIQRAAGGNPFWNDGVNYASLLARSGRADLVRDLYAAAGLDLDGDLKTLAGAPRIKADPQAVATAERKMTYTGEIRGPVIVVDNIGDPVDSEAYKDAYEHTVTRAGNGQLLRTTWIGSANHASQSAAERIAGFVRLVERLDSGEWGATDPDSMNALAARVQSETSVPLGAVRFIPYNPVNATRTWDASDWGHYKPRK